MTNALRYNNNKPEVRRVPADAIIEEAKVWTKGAAKYPDQPNGKANWERLWGDQTVSVCINSLLRHAYAINNGEARDQETGELHAALIRCNAAMLIRYQLQREALEHERDQENLSVVY
jgi:hypothetical protein